MTTGYKFKKLGQPSADKATGGDSLCATWQVVIFSEVIYPTVMTMIFILACMFIKSFPTTSERTNVQPLISIAEVSLGPIVWNMAVPLVRHCLLFMLTPHH